MSRFPRVRCNRLNSYPDVLLLPGIAASARYQIGDTSIAASFFTSNISDFGAPGFGAPGFDALDFGAPGFDALEFGALDFDAPDFGAPDFGAPDFGAPDFGAFGFGAFPDLSGSVAIQQAPPSLPSAPQQPPTPQRFHCAQVGCIKSFTRDSDRIRHQNAVHNARQGLYLCPVPGCPKSHGTGYSRADKVTAHLCEKHADLGYTKRVL
jgi:hypothetical protein